MCFGAWPKTGLTCLYGMNMQSNPAFICDVLVSHQDQQRYDLMCMCVLSCPLYQTDHISLPLFSLLNKCKNISEPDRFSKTEGAAQTLMSTQTVFRRHYLPSDIFIL